MNKNLIFIFTLHRLDKLGIEDYFEFFDRHNFIEKGFDYTKYPVYEAFDILITIMLMDDFIRHHIIGFEQSIYSIKQIVSLICDYKKFDMKERYSFIFDFLKDKDDKKLEKEVIKFQKYKSLGGWIS